MRLLHVYSGNLYGGIESILLTLTRQRAACPELDAEVALCFEGRLSHELTAERDKRFTSCGPSSPPSWG